MLNNGGEIIRVVTSVIFEGFGLATSANTFKLLLDRLVDGEVITNWAPREIEINVLGWHSNQKWSLIWRLFETPDGPISKGRYKLCGEEKEFTNSLEYRGTNWAFQPQ